MAQLFAGVALNTPPLLLTNVAKHFVARKSNTKNNMARDQFLYDQTFVIVKNFLDTAAKYGVEELQAFTATKIPAPPTVVSVHLTVPMSCCDEAAKILIKALGGEEATKKFCGGTRWWQVRSTPGVPGNWVANRKDWAKAQRTRSASSASNGSGGVPPSPSAATPTTNGPTTIADGVTSENGVYVPEFDPLPCMLYIHGGGYIFGSPDLERLCMNRYSRKMNIRVFAISYRIAPQYPFPTQLQDALAAYLYLLHPPPGALHKPVHPSQITLNGDSAGGNMVLALLQIIRDQGLPMPAGAVLVSPWCDLTHSFPSTMKNTAYDIIPRYGLSLYKPSESWPPPSDEQQHELRTSLVGKFRQAVHKATGVKHEVEMPTKDEIGGDVLPHTVLGDTLIDPSKARKAEKENPPANVMDPNFKPVKGKDYIPLPIARGVPLSGELDGQQIEMTSQIQLYCMNYQIAHPLISPVNAYLGGLCPLYIMGGNKEVLIDEITYLAHKAADPAKYPCKPELAEIYPAMKGIEQKYGPTDVHFQIYDEVCHVIPLFTWTTPSIYSYRAMNAFCRFVYKTPDVRSPSSSTTSLLSGIPPSKGAAPLPTMTEHPEEHGENGNATTDGPPVLPNISTDAETNGLSAEPEAMTPPTASATPVTPVASNGTVGRAGTRRMSSKLFSRRMSETSISSVSTNHPDLEEHGTKSIPGYAGHATVYAEVGGLPFENHLIRERVTTMGKIYPMEPAEQMVPLNYPLEMVCSIVPASARRYLEGQAIWDKKYAKTARKVQKTREKHIAQAHKEEEAKMLKMHDELAKEGPAGLEQSKHALLNTPAFSWAWALEGENPPPSSLVARRDTAQARRLAKMADTHHEQTDKAYTTSHLYKLAIHLISDPINKSESVEKEIDANESKAANGEKSHVEAAPQPVPAETATA